MTLRARLLIALLVLALAPTTLLTLYTIDQLDRAVGRRYRPGVDHALESALEVTHESLVRLEAACTLRAAATARTWPAVRGAASARAELARTLAASGLDFVQVYRREGDAWRRVDQVNAERVILGQAPALGGAIDSVLANGNPLRAPGVLAGVATTPDGDAVVAGLRLTPDFFERVSDVGQGMTYYRQLGVYLPVERRAVVAMVGIVVVLLVIAALIVAHALAGQMSRPIRDLSAAIGRVADGNLDTRVRPSGAAELVSLGASFNITTEGLERARHAAQQAEREAAWRDVARKLAHEFKNILTPMQLSLQVLEADLETLPEPSRPAARKSLEGVVREMTHLGRLAEQFSQYARLPEPNLEALDLHDVAGAVAGLEAAGALRLDGAAPPVRADRLLLTRALHNLVRNALEATTDGTPIEIRIGAAGGRAQIDVLDRGSGLAPEVRDRLFEPYVSTKRRGSGLGLSLVRDIARQHSGTLSIKDREGGGTCARLELPLAGTVGASNPDAAAGPADTGGAS